MAEAGAHCQAHPNVREEYSNNFGTPIAQRSHMGWLGVVVGGLVFSLTSFAESPREKVANWFKNDSVNCLQCHGSVKKRAGISLVLADLESNEDKQGFIHNLLNEVEQKGMPPGGGVKDADDLKTGLKLIEDWETWVKNGRK